MRFLYRLLSILTLFSSIRRGGVSGGAKTLGRRAAHRTLAKWMR